MPRAKRTPTDLRIRFQMFMRIWNTSESVLEAAERYGVSKDRARHLAWYLRASGVGLKHFPSQTPAKVPPKMRGAPNPVVVEEAKALLGKLAYDAMVGANTDAMEVEEQMKLVEKTIKEES